jgi:hypothetical protein
VVCNRRVGNFGSRLARVEWLVGHLRVARVQAQRADGRSEGVSTQAGLLSRRLAWRYTGPMPEIPLSKLPGAYIGRARNTLPACRQDSPDQSTAAIEIPDFGLVRITFTKQRNVHHRSRAWFWSPLSAETQATPEA